MPLLPIRPNAPVEPDKTLLPHDAGAAPTPPASSVGESKPPEAVMTQAKRDLDAGLVDTDMRATAGLDAKRRARLVPGPGGKPPAP